MRFRHTPTLILFLLLLVSAVSAQTTESVSEEEHYASQTGLYALFYTTMGAFACELYEDEAPENIRNFVELACGYKPWTDPRNEELRREPYYDGTVIYHVARNAMIVGGDPLANGLGSPGYFLEDEISENLTFDEQGVLAMANYGGRPNTNSGTWFVSIEPQPNLTGRYTIIGKVLNGLDTVRAISRVQARSDGRPVQEILLERVDIIRVLDNGEVVAYQRSTTRPMAELEHLPLAARAQQDLPLWMRARMETQHRFQLPRLPPLPEPESE